MKKIPLIVSLDISKCEAPIVYLPHGNWIIRGVQLDNLLIGTSDGPLPLFEGMKVRGNNYVRIKPPNVAGIIKSIKQTIEAHHVINEPITV